MQATPPRGSGSSYPRTPRISSSQTPTTPRTPRMKTPAKVQIPKLATTYTPVINDADLRGQINATLIDEGHLETIFNSLHHALSSSTSNLPELIRAHALALLRSGECTTFPSLLARVLTDIKRDTMAANGAIFVPQTQSQSQFQSQPRSKSTPASLDSSAQQSTTIAPSDSSTTASSINSHSSSAPPLAQTATTNNTTPNTEKETDYSSPNSSRRDSPSGILGDKSKSTLANPGIDAAATIGVGPGTGSGYVPGGGRTSLAIPKGVVAAGMLATRAILDSVVVVEESSSEEDEGEGESERSEGNAMGVERERSVHSAF